MRTDTDSCDHNSNEDEESFANEIALMIRNSAVAVAGHNLWVQVCAACNSARPAPTHAEMSRLLFHLKSEFVVDVSRIDPELGAMILSLPANWHQVCK